LFDRTPGGDEVLVKRLEVLGFKSFAERTVLEFGPGTTAIVGPNGAGKSNVTDAIRWVLGEQNPRVLRCSRMEDIIFGGSGTRKPLGFAEVCLVLDNQDGRLPLAFTEVSLTRRLYRSGESEYLLNGSPTRLRDLTDLLAGTGLGREGYSLVGQGRIEELLMSTPEGRRAVFDEACGIGLHRARKKEALARLSDVSSRLERVSDVVAEIEAQMEPLERQATVARTFVTYREEFERLELWLEARSLERLRSRSAASRERLEEIRGQEEATRRQIGLLEEEVRTLRQALEELGNLIDQRQRDVARSEAERRGLEDKARALSQRLTELERGTEFAERERAQLAERRRRLEARRLDLAASRSRRVQSLDETRRDLALATSEETAGREQVSQLRQTLEAAKAELLEVVSRASGERYEVRTVETELGRLVAEEQRLEKESAQDREELARVEEEAAGVARRLEEVSAKLAERQARLRELEEREADLSLDLARSGRALDEEKETLSRLERERASLEAEVYAASAWSRSALAVAAARDRSEPAREGLVGVLGEELEVAEADRVAVEAALGRYAQALVVRSEEDLRRLLGRLRGEGLGPAVMIPLDLVGRHLSRHPSLLGRAGALGLPVLAERVGCPDGLRPVIEYLLGSTVLAHEPGEALRVVAEGVAPRAVTPDGVEVRDAGEVTLASAAGRGRSGETGSGGGAISRMRRLAEVRREMGEHSRRLEELLERRRSSEAALVEVRGERARLAGEHQALVAEATGLSGRLEDLRRRAEGLGRRVERINLDLPEMARRRSALEARGRQARERLERWTSREGEVREQLFGQETALREAERRLGASSARVAELRVRLAALEEQERGEVGEDARLQAELDGLRDEEERLARRLEGLAEERAKVGEELAPLKEQLAVPAAGPPGTADDLEEWRTRRRETAERLAMKERELDEARRALEEAAARLQREEVRLARFEAEEGLTVKGLERDWGDSWEEKAARATETLLAGGGTVDEATAQSRVEELRRAMASLGVVNIGAVEEHRRLSERARFLREQIADLTESRAGLLELVAEMDETMAKRFEEGFHAVRRAFREKVAELFGGGHGDLLLTDRDNLLESGVEILVQPPSKRLQSLSLLSAGERALAALALLLAFLEVRPSPLVVLDEIDAPLDDANVSRFCAAVTALAATGRTQFIVVTHNKATMEASEALYGVTMGDDGVSRLVSVRLEDRQAWSRRLGEEGRR